MSGALNRILCIDDDRDILDVVKICLETVGGYDVFTCAVGSDAVHTIRDVRPDIILLDVMMPGMDGSTIIKTLQADTTLRAIPVIFMTARVQPREVGSYLEQGAVAVIAKPFDPMQLGTEVAKAWQRAQEMM